jgi:hypothetical protein
MLPFDKLGVEGVIAELKRSNSRVVLLGPYSKDRERATHWWCLERITPTQIACCRREADRRAPNFLASPMCY